MMERHCGYWSLLLETLVDACRFAGICYRAANWILLGETQGCGPMDRYHHAVGSARKLLFVYPSAATSSSGSERSSRLASLKPRQIGLDKARGGGKQLGRR